MKKPFKIGVELNKISYLYQLSLFITNSRNFDNKYGVFLMNLELPRSNYIFYFIFLQIILLMVIGCSSNKINLVIKCSNESNNGNAVVISILQLASPEKFESASKESLLKNPKEVLGNELIYSKQQSLVPGQLLPINDYEIKEGVLFLGIMGDFYSPSGNRWRQIYNLQSRKHNLEIHVLNNAIEIKNK